MERFVALSFGKEIAHGLGSCVACAERLEKCAIGGGKNTHSDVLVWSDACALLCLDSMTSLGHSPVCGVWGLGEMRLAFYPPPP